MRKAAYFLLILLTGYVAGMYANPALMVLTAAQAFAGGGNGGAAPLFSPASDFFGAQGDCCGRAGGGLSGAADSEK